MKLFCNSCDGIYDSIDVRFTKVCDNNCAFCIEKNGAKSKGSTNENLMALNTISSGIKNVLILGGEPLLLQEKVYSYITQIREYANHIYLTTSLPKINDKELLYKIIDKLDGLNVSIQSVDWEENNKILNAISNHNRLEMLKEINEKFFNKTRVSINLIKGGIDTKEKLEYAIDYLESIGCYFIKINELQNEEDLYISYEDIMGIKLKSPYSNGCQTFLKYDVDHKILLKRSCFLVEKSRKGYFSDLIKALLKKIIKRNNKFLVIYEDGSVKKGWEKC